VLKPCSMPLDSKPSHQHQVQVNLGREVQFPVSNFESCLLSLLLFFGHWRHFKNFGVLVRLRKKLLLTSDMTVNQFTVHITCQDDPICSDTVAGTKSLVVSQLQIYFYSFLLPKDV
jgi:hypothetical protein